MCDHTVKGSDPQEAYWNEDGLIMHNQIYSNEMYHADGRVWEINAAEGNVFRVSFCGGKGWAAAPLWGFRNSSLA